MNIAHAQSGCADSGMISPSLGLEVECLGGIVIRKFICPFCSYVHVFSPKDKSKWKKRVVGFTCPGCGKKPTDNDFKKKKGRGPKPKDQRRKRVKKEVVKEIPPVVVQPYVEQFEWRTSGPPPPGEPRRYGGRAGWRPKPSQTNPGEPQHPGARNNRRGDYTRWEPRKPPQPMDRTLGEAAMSSLHIRPSAPIPHQNLRSEEKLENKEYRKIDIEKLEKHEKKLALMIVRLDRVEERLDATVNKLDIRLTELDSKLQALSTLTSHMGMFLDVAERKRVLVR